MQYVSLDACKRFVFPYIYEQLSGIEPSAQYDLEEAGLNELNKVLCLVKNDTFYPGFHYKAAYLLCSIVGSQYFSNGNKRLGVIVLMSFLILNKAERRVLTIVEYQKLLERFFPKHVWENNLQIGEGDPLFLYNLAIVIGTRSNWGNGVKFDGLKQKVSEMLSEIYRLPISSDE